MKYLPFLFATMGLLLPFGGLSPSLHAEEFRGHAVFRGVLRNRSNNSLLKSSMRARFMRSSQGNEVHANWTGRFQRIPQDNLLGSYPGSLRTAVNRDREVSRDLTETTVVIRRRRVVFDEGKIRLERRVRSNREGRQRLKGRGRLKVEA